MNLLKKKIRCGKRRSADLGRCGQQQWRYNLCLCECMTNDTRTKWGWSHLIRWFSWFMSSARFAADANQPQLPHPTRNSGGFCSWHSCHPARKMPEQNGLKGSGNYLFQIPILEHLGLWASSLLGNLQKTPHVLVTHCPFVRVSGFTQE